MGRGEGDDRKARGAPEWCLEAAGEGVVASEGCRRFGIGSEDARERAGWHQKADLVVEDRDDRLGQGVEVGRLGRSDRCGGEACRQESRC